MADFWSDIGVEYRGELLHHLEKLAARAKSEAPDLLQDLAIILRNQEYPEEDRSRRVGFLKQRAKWRLIDLLRTSWYKRFVNFDDALAEAESKNDSHIKIEQRVLSNELLVEVKSLRKRLREPFLLSLEGLDTPQIAERLGYKQQTVANLLTLAGTELRRRLGFAIVKGKVTDGTDSPIGGVRVFFRGDIIDRTAETKTNQKGAFRSEWLECGKYLLKCTAPDYRRHEQNIDVFIRMKPLLVKLTGAERRHLDASEVSTP